jgi:hypothetical protein
MIPIGSPGSAITPHADSGITHAASFSSSSSEEPEMPQLLWRL